MKPRSRDEAARRARGTRPRTRRGPGRPRPGPVRSKRSPNAAFRYSSTTGARAMSLSRARRAACSSADSDARRACPTPGAPHEAAAHSRHVRAGGRRGREGPGSRGRNLVREGRAGTGPGSTTYHSRATTAAIRAISLPRRDAEAARSAPSAAAPRVGLVLHDLRDQLRHPVLVRARERGEVLAGGERVRGRVELHPAQVAEVHLDPGVRLEGADLVEVEHLRLRVHVEAHRHARGDAEAAAHQCHGEGEVRAVALLGDEEEMVQLVAVLRDARLQRVQVVASSGTSRSPPPSRSTRTLPASPAGPGRGSARRRPCACTAAGRPRLMAGGSVMRRGAAGERITFESTR